MVELKDMLFSVVMPKSEVKNEAYNILAKTKGINAIEEFGQDILNYVNGNLEVALTATPAELENNYIGEVINKKALADAEYKKNLVNYIAARGIYYTLPAYKPEFEKELRRTVYMRSVYEFLSFKQIGLIAEYYDKALSQENKKERSR